MIPIFYQSKHKNDNYLQLFIYCQENVSISQKTGIVKLK